MSRAAMQQALEALMMMRDKCEEYACPEYACPACNHADAAITTLRKALAEPEQHDTDCHAQGVCQRSGYSIAPTPRNWVGLTDEEIDVGLCRSPYALQTAQAWRDGVEWAQEQLKEKNT